MNQIPVSDVYSISDDFILRHTGNVFTLRPISLAAQRYTDQFFPRDPMAWFENQISIPLPSFVDVLSGIQSSGLLVGRVA